MLDSVERALEQCSDAERAKVARFAAAQAEQNLNERPGASRIFSWLGVLAAGRQPHEISLSDTSQEDRMYVMEVSATLQQVTQGQSTLEHADTPQQLVDGEPHASPTASVWGELRSAVADSLATD